MINFIKYRRLYFLLSALVIMPGIISLLIWGLKLSIDFVGGTTLELKFEESIKYQVSSIKLEGALEEGGVEVATVQPSTKDQFIIKTRPIDEGRKTEIKKMLADKFGGVEEIRFETVGPTLGRELLRKTLIAIILAAGFVLAYVAFQFRDKMYGICAILAMFHDTLILLGSFSILGHFLNVEIDTLFVTAILTTLSFSVHDTVVTYDSIRAAAKKNVGAKFSDLVNRAISQTLIRNLNNSLTIIFMLASLVLLGGSTIRWFVATLLIGTIAGTYSSTFIATPLLVVWKEITNQVRRR